MIRWRLLPAARDLDDGMGEVTAPIFIDGLHRQPVRPGRKPSGSRARHKCVDCTGSTHGLRTASCLANS